MLKAILAALSLLPTLALSTTKNSTFTNPMLPGWHSDPSCIYVAKKFNSFFCTTSSFLAFPGMPVYTSKDLVNWRLSSYIFSRREQVPQIGNTTVEYAGLWATTLRYHGGKFYAIVAYTPVAPWSVTAFIFTSTNPYDSSAWSDPLSFPAGDIDGNLFWDDDGQVYMQYSGISQQTIDLETGALGNASLIWNGWSHFIPEGPHMYKRDGYYYLLIGEGGTELGHHVAIARSRNIWGPYEGCPDNPILTNTNTSEYFQTVGHADLFQDASGNWWGTGLATRSGPAWENYPMGRETVLFPVTWEKGEWPILQPVRGKMSGWPLPRQTRAVPGIGPFVNDPDVYDFPPGSAIPAHFQHWRFPPANAFAVSPKGHPNTLRITPSEPMSLIMRVQTDTLFSFSVDVVSFSPKVLDEEVGVTAFIAQTQHLDLGIVLLPTSSSNSQLAPHLRFRVTQPQVTVTYPLIKAIPTSWFKAPIRLYVAAINETHYTFSAASSLRPFETLHMGTASATLLSGGDGRFTGKPLVLFCLLLWLILIGTVVGAYATSNGGKGTTDAYISRWRYQGKGQDIDNGTFVPYTPFVGV